MEVKKAIEERRTIRRFKTDDPVPPESVLELMEAARLAPSGGNLQPWRFIIVRDKEMKREIAELAGNQPFIIEAPVLIVCCGDMRALKERPKAVRELVNVGALERVPQAVLDDILKRTQEIYGTELHTRGVISNCYIAIAFMVLQAMELGLATAWIGYFDQDKLKALLGIPPDDVVIASLLAVGYQDEHPRQRPRKRLEEIMFMERWGGR